MDNEVQSSIVSQKTEKLAGDQFEMPSWGIMIALILAFFLLKSFIYIKDSKRHGK